MPVFRNSDMTMYSADGEWSIPCEVRIDAGSIAVSYDDEDGPVVYEGTEEGAGHFRLTAPRVAGRATLHRFYADDMLEGFWVESGHEGMWRIQLEA